MLVLFVCLCCDVFVEFVLVGEAVGLCCEVWVCGLCGCVESGDEPCLVFVGEDCDCDLSVGFFDMYIHCVVLCWDA